MLLAQYGGGGIGDGITAGINLSLAIAFLSLAGAIFGVYGIIHALMQRNHKTAFRLGLTALAIGLGISCWLGLSLQYFGFNARTAMAVLPIILGLIAVWASFHPPEEIND
jgi:hypothetical protein